MFDRLLRVALILSSCLAQAETPPETPKQISNVSKELAQTISSLFSITIQDYFVASRWDRSNEANAVELRTLTPFKAWNQENLLRINIPFRTLSELGPGLSDTRIFDLLMFKHGSGSWGVGPAFNLRINRPDTDAFQVGPAATVLWTWIPGLSFGLLNQNFFSDQVAFSTLQPILAYELSPTWTISLGELPVVYDWKKWSFVVTSIGLQLGALVRPGAQPVRLFVNPQFNTTSNSQLYQWTITSGVTLPVSPVVRQ